MDIRTVRSKGLSRRAALRLAGAGAATAGAAALAMPKANGAVAQATASIAGAWMTRVVRPDGTIAAGLLAFTSDGIIIRTGTLHPTMSPNVGLWTRQGDSYTLFYLDFVFDTNGNWIGMSQTRGQATLSADGNSYDSTFAIDSMDTSGNIMQTMSGGTAHATRLQVQPL